MIEGVIVQQLKQIADERGKVMHMLRCDSPLFDNFGEIYFSVIYKDAIKAWKLHQKMTLNLAVPFGNIKLVLFDNRQKSSTGGEIQELSIGQNNYCLVKIPPMIWTGFQGIAGPVSIIANCATLPHDPDEVNTLGPFDDSIPFKW